MDKLPVGKELCRSLWELEKQMGSILIRRWTLWE